MNNLHKNLNVLKSLKDVADVLYLELVLIGEFTQYLINNTKLVLLNVNLLFLSQRENK